MDYYDLSVPLDFVSHDQYPGGFSTSDTKANGWKSAANLDVVRSYKNKNFWIICKQLKGDGVPVRHTIPHRKVEN